LKNVWPAWRTDSAPADPGFFPPELVVRVKAIACELPHRFGVPLSRWSVAELGAHVRTCGLTASVSDTTIWRWLSEDAIRPWQHRCWIFPRDPDFEAKAGRILDLYQRIWKGRKLGAHEFVISAVPTKKSVRIEIVAFMESRPVTFPNHVHFAFLPARLLAIPRRSAGRNSCPPSSAIDLRAFPPRSSPASALD
jgi:hypothetical protein